MVYLAKVNGSWLLLDALKHAICLMDYSLELNSFDQQSHLVIPNTSLALGLLGRSRCSWNQSKNPRRRSRCAAMLARVPLAFLSISPTRGYSGCHVESQEEFEPKEESFCWRSVTFCIFLEFVFWPMLYGIIPWNRI